LWSHSRLRGVMWLLFNEAEFMVWIAFAVAVRFLQKGRWKKVALVFSICIIVTGLGSLLEVPNELQAYLFMAASIFWFCIVAKGGKFLKTAHAEQLYVQPF